jgi:hypothetical protein
MLSWQHGTANLAWVPACAGMTEVVGKGGFAAVQTKKAPDESGAFHGQRG